MSHNRKPFGEVLIANGLTSRARVKEALQAQQEEDRIGKRHRLLGIILLEGGALSSADLIRALKLYNNQIHTDGKPSETPQPELQTGQA